MSELINSSANFYLNAETYNPTSQPIDAVITVRDRDDEVPGTLGRTLYSIRGGYTGFVVLCGAER